MFNQVNLNGPLYLKAFYCLNSKLKSLKYILIEVSSSKKHLHSINMDFHMWRHSHTEQQKSIKLPSIEDTPNFGVTTNPVSRYTYWHMYNFFSSAAARQE